MWSHKSREKKEKKKRRRKIKWNIMQLWAEGFWSTYGVSFSWTCEANEMSRRSIWSEAGSHTQRPNRNYVSHRGDVQEDCLAPFVVNKSAGGRGQVMGLPVPTLPSALRIMVLPTYWWVDWKWLWVNVCFRCVCVEPMTFSKSWQTQRDFNTSAATGFLLADSQTCINDLYLQILTLGWEIYLPHPCCFYTVDVQDFHFTTEWSWLQCFFFLDLCVKSNKNEFVGGKKTTTGKYVPHWDDWSNFPVYAIKSIYGHMKMATAEAWSVVLVTFPCMSIREKY